MNRVVTVALLLIVLTLNTYSGIAKVMGFYHGNRGAKELSRAELDQAFESLRRAVEWLPDESAYHVTIGRVVAMAQANGLHLAALEGLSQIEIFSVGAAATARGIALNPGDAWAWFNLGGVYEGYGDARFRLERMIEAGRAASRGEAEPDPVQQDRHPRGLTTEDRLAAAAAVMAQDMEPEFFFYGEFLADLYWERGLAERAEQEIRDSFALMPRVKLHFLLEDEEVVSVMGDSILEGIALAAANPYLSPSRAARARADIMERLERHEEAIESWQELSRLGGESHPGEADLEIGRLMQRRQLYGESLPFLMEALATGAERGVGAIALYYLGRAHGELGNHETAVDFYRQSIDRRQTSLGGYLGLASELVLLGKDSQAERTYIDAIRRFPDHKLTYELLIKLMISNGREMEAEPYAVALRKKDPGNQTALALLGKLKRGPVDR